MTKNSARKKAARAYQQQHPGTSLSAALRAVTTSEENPRMNTTPTETPSSPRPSTTGIDPQTRSAAIAALTAIARSTHPGGSPVDFADVLADIVTTVAANVGSLENLLLGRSGSWEAALVAQLVEGTAPEDQLPARRTEPVELFLHIDNYWVDCGLEDVCTEDRDEIERDRDVHAEGSREDEALDDELMAVDDLEEADRAAYIAAWTEQARIAAAEFGVTVPVTVTVLTWGTKQYPEGRFGFEEDIAGRAAERTPHPTNPELTQLVGTFSAPSDDLAARIRAAGHSYRARVAAAGS
ncbi:hypothetical protein [Rhodococcus sp. RDE2]|uniref:hypothetical protein n=1 Tax=Rhodococcus sp. RDE2 TaxID=2885078 RepID=UPI001E5A6526|nr:hypothetical protein [Rhodococcus sp. RDE2]BDB63540.1 hypothetical protein RDE2_53340 [Rhodococcus sp. RDE2]